MTPRKAQTAQTAPNDQLDAAIDQVAARMVAVPDDPDLTLRIVSALPERSSRLGWLIPQLTALGLLAVAAVLWSMRGQPVAPTVLRSTGIAAIAAFPSVTARAPERGTPVRTVGTQPSEPPELPALPELDFDRALPALELSVIGPQALPATEALMLAPIEISALPLTAETTSSKFE
jgi:hypothetical protein